ncbi:Response regulator receiver protein [Candidatus Sulfopaludibacter sp. SbA6]|nr:Response regulator receiver protein [Candidatus Sulfopaludibacter sp. SbA6]
MWRSPEMESDLANLITVLNLDPLEADHASLIDISARSEWTLASTPTVESALESLRVNRIPILFCNSDLRPGLWQEMLDRMLSLPDPPFLVVTSRLADDRLWAEALNLGAYDVLAKPFDKTEVNRIVRSAWLRWTNRKPSATALTSGLSAVRTATA